MTRYSEIISIVAFFFVLQVTAFFRSHYPVPVPFRPSGGHRHTSSIIHIPIYHDRLIIVKKPGSHHYHQDYDHGHIHKLMMNHEHHESLVHDLWHRHPFINDHLGLRKHRGAGLFQNRINNFSRLPTLHWNNRVNFPSPTESLWLK
ncbi:hypothetical protein TNIN_274161 [Trichonephila inaurata madagascariensis]|uniref:Uncharacterized protein n=1 Tax=Trichonephila inaurata madagascariensis TaxID=2747483 RepID=A0A8X6XBP9_9ARAC|nr:hypothetical protein TNIN_274161 [Trichonephila inaurata madagascariensis]